MVILYPCSGSLLCTDMDSIQSETGHSEFNLPSDLFSEQAFPDIQVLDHRRHRRPPCMVCNRGPELNRPNQCAGGSGLSHIHGAVDEVRQ